jgi:hypothetical protein
LRNKKLFNGAADILFKDWKEGKEICYMDESWVYSNIAFSKYWQREGEFSIKKIRVLRTD